MVHAEIDPLTGAARDSVLISDADADRLGLADGAPVLVRSEHGELPRTGAPRPAPPRQRPGVLPRGQRAPPRRPPRHAPASPTTTRRSSSSRSRPPAFVSRPASGGDRRRALRGRRARRRRDSCRNAYSTAVHTHCTLNEVLSTAFSARKHAVRATEGGRSCIPRMFRVIGACVALRNDRRGPRYAPDAVRGPTRLQPRLACGRGPAMSASSRSTNAARARSCPASSSPTRTNRAGARGRPSSRWRAASKSSTSIASARSCSSSRTAGACADERSTEPEQADTPEDEARYVFVGTGPLAPFDWSLLDDR